MVIESDPHETAVMERSLDELNQIGFELEPFGEQAFTLRAIPAIMTGVDIRERIHLILRELAEGGVGESWLDSVAISAACHTSIRAGQAVDCRDAGIGQSARADRASARLRSRPSDDAPDEPG